ISRRPDRIAGVITGTIGDHTRVASIVFLDFEGDLHQVRTDIGDLRKDAPATRSAAAPSDSPMANPIKHGPARFPGMNNKMQSIKNSSTLINSIPMLMPACIGM